jgi:hypothetical protein
LLFQFISVVCLIYFNLVYRLGLLCFKAAFAGLHIFTNDHSFLFRLTSTHLFFLYMNYFTFMTSQDEARVLLFIFYSIYYYYGF